MASQGKNPQKSRKQTQPTPGSQKTFYIILGLVAVVGVGFLIFQSTRGGQPATQFVGEPLTPSQMEEVEGVARGPEDAPVLIEEFSDFLCPACAQYNALQASVVKERLVDTGQARYVYYHFPVVRPIENGFLAARAARCANEQDAFWTYGEVLYARQPEWGGASNPAGRFVDFAEQMGLDRGSFSSCLNSDRYAEEVAANAQLGFHRGVQGTPTVFVNGEVVRQSAADILEAAAAALNEDHAGE